MEEGGNLLAQGLESKMDGTVSTSQVDGIPGHLHHMMPSIVMEGIVQPCS